MGHFEHLLSLAVESIFINNILLAYFLGMCSFLACSKNIKTATGLGFAVIFVLSITTPLNWIIQNLLLTKGALTWLSKINLSVIGIDEHTLQATLYNLDLSFLGFLAFIAVIAAFVQLVEMLMDKYFPPLYNSLGIFLPLIAVNCAILGSSLFMVERHYTFSESAVFGFSSGIGWLLAILALAGINQKLKYANLPKGLDGFAISMIATGLISMAFMAFAGIKLTS